MKQFAVIGNPIEHSLSPVLHNWVFKSLNIQAEYTKIRVEEKYLSEIVAKVKNDELDGFNVTIPYKESIIPYLDTLDESAETIAAVNCVAGEIGYNTDWIGFLKAMFGNGIEINGKNCLIIGAGAVSYTHLTLPTILRV